VNATNSPTRIAGFEALFSMNTPTSGVKVGVSVTVGVSVRVDVSVGVRVAVGVLLGVNVRVGV
jgi:hypothetical protein